MSRYVENYHHMTAYQLELFRRFFCGEDMLKRDFCKELGIEPTLYSRFAKAPEKTVSKYLSDKYQDLVNNYLESRDFDQLKPFIIRVDCCLYYAIKYQIIHVRDLDELLSKTRFLSTLLKPSDKEKINFQGIYLECFSEDSDRDQIRSSFDLYFDSEKLTTDDFYCFEKFTESLITLTDYVFSFLFSCKKLSISNLIGQLLQSLTYREFLSWYNSARGTKSSLRHLFENYSAGNNTESCKTEINESLLPILKSARKFMPVLQMLNYHAIALKDFVDPVKFEELSNQYPSNVWQEIMLSLRNSKITMTDLRRFSVTGKCESLLQLYSAATKYVEGVDNIWPGMHQPVNNLIKVFSVSR